MDVFSVLGVMQLIVVVTSHWDAIEAKLYRYERNSFQDPWKLVVDAIDADVGQKGMAWGRGLHGDREGRLKREGDNKTPAGIFSLGCVFGDAAHQHFARKMAFVLVDEDLECVDDASSYYYNRLVHRKQIADCDWKSSEKMKEIGEIYALGIFIEHNTQPVQSGMGSAIFMHIWRESKIGTAGCTVMKEQDLKDIVFWLDADKKPCIVQLPIEEYIKMEEAWNLPALPKASPLLF